MDGRVELEMYRYTVEIWALLRKVVVDPLNPSSRFKSTGSRLNYVMMHTKMFSSREHHSAKEFQRPDEMTRGRFCIILAEVSASSGQRSSPSDV